MSSPRMGPHFLAPSSKNSVFWKVDIGVLPPFHRILGRVPREHDIAGLLLESVGDLDLIHSDAGRPGHGGSLEVGEGPGVEPLLDELLQGGFVGGCLVHIESEVLEVLCRQSPRTVPSLRPRALISSMPESLKSAPFLFHNKYLRVITGPMKWKPRSIFSRARTTRQFSASPRRYSSARLASGVTDRIRS